MKKAGKSLNLDSSEFKKLLVKRNINFEPIIEKKILKNKIRTKEIISRYFSASRQFISNKKFTDRLPELVKIIHPASIPKEIDEWEVYLQIQAYLNETSGKIICLRSPSEENKILDIIRAEDRNLNTLRLTRAEEKTIAEIICLTKKGNEYSFDLWELNLYLDALDLILNYLGVDLEKLEGENINMLMLRGTSVKVQLIEEVERMIRK